MSKAGKKIILECLEFYEGAELLIQENKEYYTSANKQILTMIIELNKKIESLKDAD